MQHIGKTTNQCFIFYCTAKMGGGERGKEAWAMRWEEKIWLLNPEKYQHWILSVGIFFRGEDYGIGYFA